ncbi:hypothetical protein ACIQMR_31535 [Streptomyces sp. NPDC091376]|uniref:hypothetical protein n=1 Tax=Streptomyces sp. NPDC091376 TaxID=3365994 RepID=UPI00380AC8E4
MEPTTAPRPLDPIPHTGGDEEFADLAGTEVISNTRESGHPLVDHTFKYLGYTDAAENLLHAAQVDTAVSMGGGPSGHFATASDVAPALRMSSR